MKGIKIKDMYFADAYLQMFDLLDDCIIIIDKDEKIIFMNKASESLDKLNRDEVIGKKYREVYKVNVHSSSTLKCLNSKEPVSNMFQDYITESGNNIITISSSYPLVEDGEMQGVFSVTKNMSKYKEHMKIFNKNYKPKDEKFAHGETSYDFEDLIGEDASLEKTISMARTAAETQANILIYGETGTGKELFAQSIHNASGLMGNFVSINCAAIPGNLLESMLFGTVKGAYTGAVDKAGLFEEADGGSLFLDELNSMSPELQAKILRAVETGRIRRLGENKERVIDVKIISSTNVHPIDAIDKGQIRRDLYYRLGVVSIKIPPLRERKGDVLVLADHFIKVFNEKYDKNVETLSDSVKEALESYEWKGNVRELQHNIEHSMIMVDSDKKELEFNDLPDLIKDFYQEEAIKDEGQAHSETLYIEEDQGIDDHLKEIERNIIIDQLEKCDGNVTRAADRLGLSRQTLDYRLKKYKIKI